MYHDGATHGSILPLAVHQVVSADPVRDDVVGTNEPCGSHAQRIEDAFLDEIEPEFASHAVDHHAQNHVAGVVVPPLLSRRKSHGLSGKLADQFVFREVLVEVVLGVAIFPKVIPQAGGVRKQAPDRYVVPRGRRFRQIFGDFIVQPDFACFDQHHHRSRGERLCQGSGVEYHLRRHWDVEFDVCQAVSRGLDDLPVAHYGQADARDVLFAHLRCERFHRLSPTKHHRSEFVRSTLLQDQITRNLSIQCSESS